MRTISIVKYFFTAIGLAMLIGAFFLFANTQDFIKNAHSVNGTVVDLVRSRSSDSVTYAPVVQFQTNSGDVIEFTSSSGSNPPSFYEGEMVEVLYPVFSPRDAKINSFFSLWGMSTIVGGIGFIFFLVGFSIILVGMFSNKKVEFLKKNGMPIKAKFTGVDINGSLTVNGRNPFKISAQWTCPEKSELYIFRSDNIWFDPSDHIENEEITVLIEKGNPKKYWMDVSFLPKIVG